MQGAATDPAREELITLLYEKIKRGHSWETFLVYNKGRISKRRARALLFSLIPPNYELSPRGCAARMAATFLFEEVFDLYLEYHVHQLTEVPEKIMVKLWWDERVIAGSLQTVAGLSPIWPPVPNHNSWIHFIPFLLRDQKCASTVYEVMILSGLFFEVFKEIKDTRYEIPDERPTPSSTQRKSNCLL